MEMRLSYKKVCVLYRYSALLGAKPARGEHFQGRRVVLASPTEEARMIARNAGVDCRTAYDISVCNARRKRREHNHANGHADISGNDHRNLAGNWAELDPRKPDVLVKTLIAIASMICLVGCQTTDLAAVCGPRRRVVDI
jgi:hypothetical protein